MRQALIIITVTLAAVAALAAPAAAYDVHSQGSHGSLQVPKIYGAILYEDYRGPSDIFDLNEFAREHGGGSDFVTYWPERYVWRSPGYAGAQVAVVQYRVFLKTWCRNYELFGCREHWMSQPSRTATFRLSIPAGTQGAWASRYAWKLDSNYNLGVSFGVLFGGDVVVTWQTADGRFLGKQYVDYDAAGDYGCLTTYCQVSHSNKLGAYLTEWQSA